uniref:Uncharacterized protein n=1 Tax=Anguilla anguilla TaxID=7936 RepID=A0A0E9PBM1_ANGAN
MRFRGREPAFTGAIPWCTYGGPTPAKALDKRRVNIWVR